MDTNTPKRKMTFPRITTEEVATKKRSNKPATEKRRRERINNYLEQLKTIVLQKTNKEGTDGGRLEKTDILEMTVQYLQNSPHPSIQGSAGMEQNSFNEGYQACLSDVLRHLNRVPFVSIEGKVQLQHCLLEACGQQDVSPASIGHRPTALRHPQLPFVHQLPVPSPDSVGSISPIGVDINDSGIDLCQSGTWSTLQQKSDFLGDYSVPGYFIPTPVPSDVLMKQCYSGEWNRSLSHSMNNSDCVGGMKPDLESSMENSEDSAASSMWRPW